jgi:hypothetical protein
LATIASIVAARESIMNRASTPWHLVKRRT